MTKFESEIIKLNNLATKAFHFFLMNTYQGQYALNYLHYRGLTDETINSYMLGFAPRKAIMYKIARKHGFSDNVMQACGLFTRTHRSHGQLVDRFYDRVMIPIADENGHVIGFSGRTLTNGKFTAKYLDIPENRLFQGRKALFNEAHAVDSVKQNGVILCEGFMDVISMEQSGVHNAMASLGTSLAPEQIQALRQLTDRVTVCYDGDEPGQNGIESAVKKLLKAGFKVSAISLPNNLDPDDYRRTYGEASLRKYVAKYVMSGVDFLLARIGQRAYRENDIQTTRDLVYLHNAVKLIKSLHDSKLQAKYVIEVAHQLDVDVSDVAMQVA